MMPGYGFNGICDFGIFGSNGWISWIANIGLSVVILIGLVLLVIWAVRRITNSQSGSMLSPVQTGSGFSTARDILQARYASGEITREQYQQMLADIR